MALVGVIYYRAICGISSASFRGELKPTTIFMQSNLLWHAEGGSPTAFHKSILALRLRLRVWNVLVHDIYGLAVVNKRRRGGSWRAIYIRDPHVLSACTAIGAITSIFINHSSCLWNSLQFIDLDMLTQQKRIMVGSFLFFSFFGGFPYFICMCLHVRIYMWSKDQWLQGNSRPLISMLTGGSIHLLSSTRELIPE